MAKDKLRSKDLTDLGFKDNKSVSMALDAVNRYHKHESLENQLLMLKKLIDNPQDFEEDMAFGKIAFVLQGKDRNAEYISEIELNTDGISYPVYGRENIEEGAFRQMEIASHLPVAVAGALMPDAHQGYGLPIGGVLATRNAVIPYGVGVDIGCRMCLSIFSIEPLQLEKNRSTFKRELQYETLFGAGSELRNPLDDAIFDRPDFQEIRIARAMKEKAQKQIGTSGSGNHFVEFGLVEILDPTNEMGLAVGKYVGLLSHSGSRGLGASIAEHYTKIAMHLCRLPKDAKHLAWLSLDSVEGDEYWRAMNLAGDYASACHHHIHYKLAKALGEKPLAMVENHHNFAWKEKLADGSEVIVHRKGATPAGKGVLGIIPGSMTTEGFIVRGKGNENSINSAAHGAGRLMSRRKAIDTITKKDLKEVLEKSAVELIGGSVDEAPMAYKDIHKVMGFQRDLVEILGTFLPKIVRMDN